MNILSQILSSQARAGIFHLLFNEERPAIYLREIVRKSGLTIGTIQKELVNLKKLDLIQSRKDGNRLYYAANEMHPLFEIICELVKKTSGIPEKLKEILSTIPGIEVAFIFGSYARGEEKSHSDIDLIIIGDVGLRMVTPRLKKASEEIDREVNPHIYSEKTWKEKLQKNDHFIKSVLNAKKMMLIGDEDVLS